MKIKLYSACEGTCRYAGMTGKSLIMRPMAHGHLKTQQHPALPVMLL
jgi:hypothetical protein